MLIVTEVAEACEADRKNKHASNIQLPTIVISGGVEQIINSKNRFSDAFETSIKNTFEDEMADIIIRVLDVCGAMKIDIDWHIEQKLIYNSTRPYKHNKAY
jgi:NTP pyrophosphatase (non-canonical NTP hydrolase)